MKTNIEYYNFADMIYLTERTTLLSHKYLSQYKATKPSHFNQNTIKFSNTCMKRELNIMCVDFEKFFTLHTGKYTSLLFLLKPMSRLKEETKVHLYLSGTLVPQTFSRTHP